MSIRDVAISNLRLAFRAWKQNDIGGAQNRIASGWLKHFIPEPNLSIYDRIEEMVNEIELLRGVIARGCTPAAGSLGDAEIIKKIQAEYRNG